MNFVKFYFISAITISLLRYGFCAIECANSGTLENMFISANQPGTYREIWFPQDDAQSRKRICVDILRYIVLATQIRESDMNTTTANSTAVPGTSQISVSYNCVYMTGDVITVFPVLQINTVFIIRNNGTSLSNCVHLRPRSELPELNELGVPSVRTPYDESVAANQPLQNVPTNPLPGLSGDEQKILCKLVFESATDNVNFDGTANLVTKNFAFKVPSQQSYDTEPTSGIYNSEPVLVCALNGGRTYYITYGFSKFKVNVSSLFAEIPETSRNGSIDFHIYNCERTIAEIGILDNLIFRPADCGTNLAPSTLCPKLSCYFFHWGPRWAPYMEYPYTKDCTPTEYYARRIRLSYAAVCD